MKYQHLLCGNTGPVSRLSVANWELDRVRCAFHDLKHSQLHLDKSLLNYHVIKGAANAASRMGPKIVSSGSSLSDKGKIRLRKLQPPGVFPSDEVYALNS